MSEKKRDSGFGYHLRVLKFLCKRQNEACREGVQNLELLAIKTSAKTWNTLLDEINAYRDKPMKAASLERSLRELKRYGYIVPTSENSSRYIISPEGFEVVGIRQVKSELKEKISLPPRYKGHVNIECRSCNIVDGYLPEDTSCRYCGSPLYAMDQV